MIKGWRQALKQSESIFLRKEFHATDFVAGRGRIAPKIIPMGRRCAIFREGLTLLDAMEHLIFVSVAMNNQEWAYERLLNRINHTMVSKGSQGILISDEGKAAEYTKLVRRMAVHNPIPSQFGS